jgi:thymidine phosphorylase
MGRFSGNWLEVWECVDIMRGVRHPMSADLIELATVLSGWMLYLGGRSASAEAGARTADEILQSGAAYAAWLKIIAAQGGDLSAFDDVAGAHAPRATRVLRAETAGYLAGMDCKEVGWAVQRLGAGRTRPGDPVSAHAGIESHAKLGDWVEEGGAIFTLFSEDESLLSEPYRMLRTTVILADVPPQRQPLIREVLLR